jgi:hypothetical protein
MTRPEGDQKLLQKIPQLLEIELGLKNAEFEVISWIPLLYQGWELDPWAVLIRLSNNKKLLIKSDHGSLLIENKPEIFLKAFEDQYTAAAQKCSDALKEII